MYRAAALVLLVAAGTLTIPAPATAAPAAPAARVTSAPAICPGILCEPFWKTKKAVILRKVP
ncbi:hypothetical protein [Cryptosporangium sp. NPDC051539]|uniref:hypothetical protein n=1 Tax=Cryptosporangium sp. NPDC051539 TaxID=3363962 RepID=UPI0037ABE8EE